VTPATDAAGDAARPDVEPPAGSPVPAGHNSSAAGPPHGLLQAFQSLVAVLVIALFILTFTVQPFRIPSASMEPTLLVGDFLLVDKDVLSGSHCCLLAPNNRIQRGDLIVFHYPVQPSLHLVKRVVGLPGDRISLRDGHAYVDGHALFEPYAVFRPSPPDNYRDDFPRMTRTDSAVNARWWSEMRSLVANGELTVPPDSYFVLGDNRNDSEDSRYWGLVPRAAIVGKPLLIYFSLRTPDDLPGQLDANATARQPTTALGQLGSFARWDRTLHVVR
jgi:signal peptidase I